MKKEDLLLVFEFLATALKQDVVEEKSAKPIKEIYEDYEYNGNYLNQKKSSEPEDNGGFNCKTTQLSDEEVSEPKLKETKGLDGFKEIREKTKFDAEKWHDDFQKENTSIEVLPTDNKTVKVIKTEAVRIKEIMDMIDSGKVYPYKKKSSVTETELDKALKLHQQNISSLINGLESKLRDSLVTPDQRRQFKKFVQMENFKAYKDLERIGYFLDNPSVENPYESKDDEPVQDAIDTETKTTLVGENKIPISNEMLAKSTVPQMIKNIMINPSVPTSVSVKIEDGQVKFKEEYKNGLGAVKRYGFDGKEIKE